MRVDVAVQSFRKPESLVYTLLTLHAHCRDGVDAVFVNDDRSSDGTVDAYRAPGLARALAPWRLRVRENGVNTGTRLVIPAGVRPRHLGRLEHAREALRQWRRTGRLGLDRADVRYQWALDETDKDRLLVLHDDIEIRGDVVGLYGRALDALPRPAVVGDLGQCWRCAFAAEGCTPARIVAGHRPDPAWPRTVRRAGDHPYACRVNEWCALVSVRAARELAERRGLLFGNYDGRADVAAYWFATAVGDGYGFSDPLPTPEARAAYYLHGWQGMSGHSVWVDQGQGRREYPRERIRAALRERFGFDWEERIGRTAAPTGPA
jgi:hypothetical protein